MSSNKKNTRRRSFGRLFQRNGNGAWLVQFPDPSGAKAKSGRTKYVTRTVSSKREGEKLLRKVRETVANGVYVAAKKPESTATQLSVLEAIDGHIESLRAQGGAESTIALYGTSRKAIERQGLGHQRVAQVTVRMVEQYMAWRRKHVWRTKGRRGEKPGAVLVNGGQASGSTVGRDRELLCAAFNRLVRLGDLVENVVRKVPKPKRSQKKRIVLSKSEVAALIQACGPRLRPIVMTLAYTGARRGEVLRLTWADLDFEGEAISLFRPKVQNASRIPMHPVLASELKTVREARAEELGRPVRDDEHVFLSRLGRPYKTFKGAWAIAVERAGLDGKGCTPHVLRHAFACHFLDAGAAVTDLQALLGHASLTTTSIYAKMVDRRTRESVAALNYQP